LEGFDFVLKDGLGLGQLSELLLPPPLLFEGLARDGLEDGSIVRVLDVGFEGLELQLNLFVGGQGGLALLF
jgi:hypothetical protein